MARNKNRGAGKSDKLSKHTTLRPAEISADAHTLPLRSWKSKPRLAALAAVAVVTVGGLTLLFVTEGRLALPDAFRASNAAPAPAFVGSEACAECHQRRNGIVERSQHKHAMQHASAASVLGDFDDASFDYFGVHSRFFKKDNKFFVETDGPDGKLATFEVKYTFGIDPLQQYLIEFPDGRIQALSIAWDSRPKARAVNAGFISIPMKKSSTTMCCTGPSSIKTGISCAPSATRRACSKNYDAASDRFATTWAEISVGCEACHGKGSRTSIGRTTNRAGGLGKDEDPAKGSLVRLNERQRRHLASDPKTGNPRRSVAPAATRKEVETCGLCHARRGEFSEDWVPGQPLSDTHVVSPLARGLYHADGQMLDEVYNYGSFKQSKMFAAGVTCSDCHEPHAAKLRLRRRCVPAMPRLRPV